MGIDYDSALIVGWSVDREAVVEFLQKYNIGSCGDDDEQCFCGPKYCWKNRAALPLQAELTFVTCSPHFDCPPWEQGCYLTLANVDNAATELAAFKALMDAVDWEAAREIAVRLGAEDKPARIWSEANVW